MSRGKYEKAKGPVGIWLAAALLLLAVTGIGGVAAKYIHESGGQNIFAAKEFYFESNLLSRRGEDYILNATAKEISFTLENHTDDLRYSQDAVNYTVTVNGQEYQKGTLKGGDISTVEITLSDLEMGQTYEVIAVGEAGYQDTLRATFKVSDEEENLYYHVDDSDPYYILLTVWAHNVSGAVTVAYPAGLIPDNTDSVMANVKNFSENVYTAGSFTDTASFANTYRSHIYRFFKTGSCGNNWTITMDYNGTTKTAEEKAPK